MTLLVSYHLVSVCIILRIVYIYTDVSKTLKLVSAIIFPLT